MTTKRKNRIDAETQKFYEGLLTSVRQMKKRQTKPVHTPSNEDSQQIRRAFEEHQISQIC